MNRRQFTFSLGALTAAPLLPALPASAAAAQPLSGSAARIYPWAAQYARVHGAASAVKLVQVFKISPAVASEVSAQLVAKGVALPTATGALKAVNPVDWQALYPRASAAPLELGKKLREGVRKLGEADVQASDEPPVIEEATGSESEPRPEDPRTGSEECPRA